MRVDLLLTLLLAGSGVSQDVQNVKALGAVGDGVADDTHAFERAFQLANATPGTTVLVPAGLFLVRPFNLTSHTTLRLAANASVAAVADERAWPLIAPAPGYGRGRDHPGPRYTSLLHGEHLVNVTVVGAGRSSVLDGRGVYWWDRVHELTYTRGHLLEFMYSRDVRVYDVHMRDSPYWFNHFYDCDGVHVRGVSIYAKDNSPNTDGWDPDSSRDILIEDSTYVGGDDCVAIKAGWDCFGVDYGKATRNVTIRNINCTGSKAGVAVGSETSGGVYDVLFDGVRVFEANGAAHVKTGPTRGGAIANITFRNIEVAPGARLGDGVLVDAHYGAPNPSCPSTWKPPPPKISNLTFSHIDAARATVSHAAIRLTGDDASPVTGVVVEDVRVGPANGTWRCAAVAGTATRVTPWPPCAGIAPV